uniref:Uncharacterized protein n=1 Tax=Acrobeloides nanus TaxID=290746 RepID=A0A914EK06_9BILA
MSCNCLPLFLQKRYLQKRYFQNAPECIPRFSQKQCLLGKKRYYSNQLYEHTLLHIHIYCCHNSRSERSDSSDGSGTMGGSCASLTTDVSQRTDFSHRTDVSQRTDFLRRTDISGRTDVTQKSYSEGIQAHKPTKKNDKTSEEICNKS